eukprot:SAG31_NODE_3943_length_3730_cov_4.533462_3_plen_208_part_00
MVLTEEGEADFYYLARNTSQPLVIPTKAQGFPTPPTFKPGTPQENGMQGQYGPCRGNMVQGRPIDIPSRTSADAAAASTQSGMSVGSYTSTMPVSIPVGMSGSVGGADNSLPGSFGASPTWGSPQWGEFDGGVGGGFGSGAAGTGGAAGFGHGGAFGGAQSGGFGGFAGSQQQQFGAAQPQPGVGQQFAGAGGSDSFGGLDAEDMEL